VTDSTRIQHIAGRVAPDLVRLRETLHRRPELAFEEHETAALLTERLRRLGLEPRTGIGGTGLTAVIEGTADGPTVGLRADMDALPVTEATGLACASEIPGRMHACGHDAHCTILIGVATVLAEMRERLHGRVLLILQPAEETLQGAAAMIADGVLDSLPMTAIFGYHCWPSLRAGAIGYHPRVIMASSDAFDVTLTGQAGHGAHPHTAVDAIVGAASFVTQAQTIVSREIAPAVPAVISIGQIEGGTARNVIAQQVTLRGTARALDPDAPPRMEAAMRRILDGVAAGHRLQATLDWRQLAPVLENHPATLARLLDAVRAELGPDNVAALPGPSMGSEDFAWFAKRLPAAHLRIGCRIEGLQTELHRANFDVHPLAIETGVRALSAALLDFLKEG
jgi:hippurate hydrolase